LSDTTAVERHSKLGASWEGFALEELLRSYEIPASDAYFWRTKAGAELDFLIHCQGQKLGFEFKYSDRPQMTPSMRIALADLQLDHLTVIYCYNFVRPSKHLTNNKRRVYVQSFVFSGIFGLVAPQATAALKKIR
jgi:predicted AAA+ superfamily ATPase